jgi:hypothetical protein
MPAVCAADLREELLARVWGPTIRAASHQDAVLAELDALEVAGDPTPPDDWELCGLVPDPWCGPPDGPDAWLADLPAELLSEYMAATEDPPCQEAIVAGRLPRQGGDGCGFAAGGAAGLGGEHPTAVEQQILDDAPGQITGQLRAAARRAVLAGDPAAGRERKERASRDARAERWDEHAGIGSGTCGHGPLGAVRLTMPLATWLGLSDAPGHAAGYGPLDAADSRDLAARLAAQRSSRWCITLTGEGERPVAHGCARTGPGPSGRSRPPPRRRHFITIRQPTCSFPGCRRPAIRCDEDHTLPYDQGDRTCGCNLASPKFDNDACKRPDELPFKR